LGLAAALLYPASLNLETLTSHRARHVLRGF
jgi:hypothetical protein